MRTRSTRRGVVGLVLPLLVAGVAACGGPRDDGVATAGGGATSTAEGPAPATDRAERRRQYVECLREHGVEVADAEQGKDVEVPEPGDELADETAKAAARACQRYAPDGGGGKAGGDVATLREYASCMRDNGIPEFPDPAADGSLTISKSILRDPNYAAADRTCSADLAKPEG